MIYCYTYIPNHPAYTVHDAISHFFNELENHNQCRFANIFNNKYTWFLDLINNTDVLGLKLRAVFRAYKRINDPIIRGQVINSFNYWNDIENRCRQNLVNELLWDELPNDIKTPIFKLFKYLYKTLTKDNGTLANANKLRRQHYSDFHNRNGRICKICAIRYLDLPDVQTNSYDHYLQISLYPFSAINYKNIVPICDKCNQSPAKGVKHMLYTDYDSRTRRIADYPYEQNVSKSVSITIDALFKQNPVITLTYNGDNINKINTWKNVFNIDSRYKGEIKENRRLWIDGLVQINEQKICTSVNSLKADINKRIRNISSKEIDLFDHLELAFWNFIINDHPELTDLMVFVNEKRRDKYNARR